MSNWRSGLRLKKDKAKHMFGSLALTLAIGLTTRKLWFAIGIVFLIGLAKEVYDYFGGGVASRADLFANVLGIGFAAVIVYLVIEKWKKR